MNISECTEVFLTHEDSYTLEFRDISSEESPKCFIESQEDYYKSVSPEVCEINGNQFDSVEKNTGVELQTHAKEPIKVESAANKEWECRNLVGLVEDEHIVCHGQSLLSFRMIKSDLYIKDGKQFRKLQTALLRSLLKYNLLVPKNYSLLLKSFYITLYDDAKSCPVASFEYLEKEHQWGTKKTKRQTWKDDIVKNSLFDEENQAFERGHFVRHGYWNYNKKMVSEMSYMTNAFPQIKEFRAYVDVEEFGIMLSKQTDVFIITCLTNECERVVKVFRWTNKDSTAILVFDFPNTQHAYGDLKPNEKRFGGNFIAPKSILQELPFEMEDTDNASFIQEQPIILGKWKETIIKSIGKD